MTTFHPEPGVEFLINRSAPGLVERPVRLVIHAAPNSNTAAEALGRASATGPDWRYGIQHIAARTRWLRHHLPDTEWVLAAVACEEKSWPVWCRKHPDSGPRIAAMISQLRAYLILPQAQLTLTGHSGGGAWIFRYLDSQGQIPDTVERIKRLPFFRRSHLPELHHRALMEA